MRQTLASTLVAPVLIVLLFGSTLVGIDRLAFRDVSHFYTPLYDYVAWRTSSQWIPLWNPLDQTGMPLLGETTTAVLYPVRYVLFRLPITSETALGWYVVLHLILASITARAAARWSGVGPIAANIAGVVYALSGSVLFLYSNPPFLVSAAWMPLAIGSLANPNWNTSGCRKAVIAGVAMSMMILGGDPQTALHVMIVASVLWLARCVRRQEKLGSLLVLLAAPLLAALLAAPQLAASISWSSQSERLRLEDTTCWSDAPVIGGKRFKSFQFSVAPWHALGLATPTPLGTLVPHHRRISQLIPGDGRMWTPTLYMGVFVLIALAFSFRDAIHRSIDPWFGVAVLSLWLAMGHFGLAWLIQSLTDWMPRADSAIGGPYWWLYQCVPGYDSFRYPAKWLPVFALASSVLAAKTVDREKLPGGLLRLLAGGLVAASILVLWLRWNPGSIVAPMADLPTDEFWGPLVVQTALSEVQMSIVHSMVALIAVAVVLVLSKKLSWSRQRLVMCLLLLLGLDLAVCGRGMIHRVSIDEERTLVGLLKQESVDPGSRWMRTQSGCGWPQTWRRSQGISRLSDVEASGRANWFGRWHLSSRVSVLNNMVSIQSFEMHRFWEATRKVTAGMNTQQRAAFWRSIRQWLAIDGVVHSTSNSTEVKTGTRIASLVDVRRTKETTVSHADLHRRWRASEDASMETVVDRLRELAHPIQKGIPILMGDDISSVPASEHHEYQRDANLRVLHQSNEQMDVEVETDAASLVVLPVYQDGHWRAEKWRLGKEEDRSMTPVYRVDFVKQGVVLPAGHWQLRFFYSPWWLNWSLAVAGAAWVSVASGWMMSIFRSYRETR